MATFPYIVYSCRLCSKAVAWTDSSSTRQWRPGCSHSMKLVSFQIATFADWASCVIDEMFTTFYDRGLLSTIKCYVLTEIRPAKVYTGKMLLEYCASEITQLTLDLGITWTYSFSDKRFFWKEMLHVTGEIFITCTNMKLKWRRAAERLYLLLIFTLFSIFYFFF